VDSGAEYDLSADAIPGRARPRPNTRLIILAHTNTIAKAGAASLLEFFRARAVVAMSRRLDLQVVLVDHGETSSSISNGQT
jgi:hypothetical protein